MRRTGPRPIQRCFLGLRSCSIHGKVSFNPPLKTGGSVASKVMVTGLLNVCSAASSGGARFNNGHLSALVGTLSANDCASLGSGTAPLISGGSIKWTPPSKVAMSTGISMPTGTGSVVTSGAKPHIQVVYSGGSIAGGSFSNSGATSLTMTSDQDSAQIQSRCTTGLSSVAFKGTATL